MSCPDNPFGEQHEATAHAFTIKQQIDKVSEYIPTGVITMEVSCRHCNCKGLAVGEVDDARLTVKWEE